MSAIVASYLSDRKGYGERPGLASGLLLNVSGVIVWLVVPPKAESRGSGRARWAASSRTPRPRGRRTRAAPSRRRPPPRSRVTAAAAAHPAAAAGSRHGAGTGTAASDCPPSPARGVTLHQTRSPVAVLDHEPVRVAEEARARLTLGLGRLEGRRVGDALVAAALRPRVGLDRAPRRRLGVGEAFGALGGAVDGALGGPLAAVRGDRALRMGDLLVAEGDGVGAVRYGQALGADGAGVDAQPRDLGLLEGRLALRGALAVSGRVVAEQPCERVRRGGEDQQPEDDERRRAPAGRLAVPGRRVGAAGVAEAAARRLLGAAGGTGADAARQRCLDVLARGGARAGPWILSVVISMREAYILRAMSASRGRTPVTTTTSSVRWR